MRIAIDHYEFFSNDLNPCSVGSPGEAEDYIVLVSNAVSCIPPSALLTSNITMTSVELDWTIGSTETTWKVIYGAAGFDPNSGGTTQTVTTLPETILTSLTSNAEYDVYVQAVCGTNDESVKIGPITFRTACAATSVPYTMDFENVILPEIGFCTSKENAGSGNDWVTAYQGSNGFTSNVLVYNYHTMSNANAWFYTQGIQLTAGTSYTISYKYGNNSSTFSEQLSVYYGTSAAFGSMTGFINQHTGINGGQATTEFVNFTVPTTDVYYFGFQAGSLQNQHLLFLDDINIYEAAACLDPSALMVGNITPSSAYLSWTAGGTETEWNVIYGPKNFNPATGGITVNVTGAPQTSISGLNPGTEYEFYVEAVCAQNVLSTRVGPIEFETTCSSVSVPYLLDFNAAIVPNLTLCTSIENAGTGNDWKTLTYNNNGFSGNVLSYTAHASNPANAWFYTQGVELQAGVEYEISYTYGNTASTPEKMKVAFGTSASAVNMTTLLASYTNINNGVANDTTQVFTVAANGTYYFGFNAFSIANQNVLYLDNINIVEKAICEAVSTVIVTDYENEQVTFIWAASPSATAGYEVEVYLAGEDPAIATPVATEIVAAGVTTVIVTGLTAGTSYDGYVVSDCDVAGKTRSGVVNFTTTTVGLEANELTQVSYSPKPVSSVLNINAESAIATVIVYNLTGKAVLEVKGSNESLSIDMSSLSNGTYIIKALVVNSVSTFKVVKQ